MYYIYFKIKKLRSNFRKPYFILFKQFVKVKDKNKISLFFNLYVVYIDAL